MAENYPGNSNKQKQQAAKPEGASRRTPSLVAQSVRVVKPSLGMRIRETFVGDDARSVAGYVFFEVVIPAAKAMLFDGVTTGVDRMLYGGSGTGPARSGARRAPSAGQSKIDYAAISQKMTKKSANQRYPGTNFEGDGGAVGRMSPDSVILESRGAVQQLVQELESYIEDYAWVSRAEFLNMVGITAEFTDEKWGWRSIDGYRIKPTRDGFQLDLPKAEYDN